MTDFWIDASQNETLWDKLYLGGRVWPGICQVEPLQDRDVTVAKRRGQEPRLIDNGYNPGQIRATLTLWREDQWNEIYDLITEFSPRKNETVRTPLEIWHPSTDVLGIDTVIVTRVFITHPTDQILSVEIQMMKWFPEKGTSSGRRKSVGRSDGGPLRESDFDVEEPNSGGNL